MKNRTARRNPALLYAGYILLLPQFLMFGVCFSISVQSLEQIPDTYNINIALNTLGIFISSLMYLSVLRAHTLEKIDILLLLFIIVNSLYMFSDGVFWIIDGIPEMAEWNLTDNTIYCIVPTVMTVIFWLVLGILINDRTVFYQRASIVMYLAALAAILFILWNIPFGYYFSVSEETGIYSRGPLYSYYLVFPTVMFGLCFLYILLSRISLPEKLILCAYPLLPYLNSLFRLGKTGPNLLSIETFCAIVFFYTNLYVRREKDLAVRDNALTESRLNALQMQINPHFFYNTLSSIASLCETSPEDAQEMIYRLSDYLRDNYSDISKHALIPFQEELNHLDHYLSIESMRFPNILIHYDIQATGFELPSLTLQPLVENSIKHGICKRRKSSGNITISSREMDDSWLISVSDDGVGFEELPQPEEGKHIGVSNVRTRLKLLCNGKLYISSIPGLGTACQIILPK